jgi:tetratricopeptide (TPR) repeat protein
MSTATERELALHADAESALRCRDWSAAIDACTRALNQPLTAPARFLATRALAFERLAAALRAARPHNPDACHTCAGQCLPFSSADPSANRGTSLPAAAAPCIPTAVPVGANSAPSAAPDAVSTDAASKLSGRLSGAAPDSASGAHVAFGPRRDGLTIQCVNCCRGLLLSALRDLAVAFDSGAGTVALELQRGRVLAELNAHDLSAASATRVLRVWPTCAPALEQLARAHRAQGQWPELPAVLDRLALADPDEVRTHMDCADALRRLGRYRDSVTSLDRALAAAKRNHDDPRFDPNPNVRRRPPFDVQLRRLRASALIDSVDSDTTNLRSIGPRSSLASLASHSDSADVLATGLRPSVEACKEAVRELGAIRAFVRESSGIMTEMERGRRLIERHASFLQAKTTEVKSTSSGNENPANKVATLQHVSRHGSPSPPPARSQNYARQYADLLDANSVQPITPPLLHPRRARTHTSQSQSPFRQSSRRHHSRSHSPRSAQTNISNPSSRPTFDRSISH